jgi:hypothetical protein
VVASTGTPKYSIAVLLAGADPNVRRAFSATLRAERSVGARVTSFELARARDVLVVPDLPQAIARAEQAIRARRQDHATCSAGAFHRASTISPPAMHHGGTASFIPYVPPPALDDVTPALGIWSLDRRARDSSIPCGPSGAPEPWLRRHRAAVAWLTAAAVGSFAVVAIVAVTAFGRDRAILRHVASRSVLEAPPVERHLDAAPPPAVIPVAPAPAAPELIVPVSHVKNLPTTAPSAAPKRSRRRPR